MTKTPFLECRHCWGNGGRWDDDSWCWCDYCDAGDVYFANKKPPRDPCETIREYAHKLKKQNDEMRSEILRMAAMCARFQHIAVDELEQEDMRAWGDHAHHLKQIYDRMGT